MRGATAQRDMQQPPFGISTRAPHAGSDGCSNQTPKKVRYFNPRSPCGERRATRRALALAMPFQPALPMRGATRASLPSHRMHCNFNPRSPCGERRFMLRGLVIFPVFQPALPMRGATTMPTSDDASGKISTRAPHAGSDNAILTIFSKAVISTRAPHAGSDCDISQAAFYRWQISTRAPHAGSDRNILPFPAIDVQYVAILTVIQREYTLLPLPKCQKRGANLTRKQMTAPCSHCKTL